MLHQVEARTGYRFREQRLLQQALTHRSFSREHNERLEFLGDAILGFLVSDVLFRLYPSYDEGQLSRLRASLVCGENLSAIARRLDLGPALLMGTGEAQSGGRNRQSNLANAVESLVAAVYLDGGVEASRSLVEHLFGAQLKQQGGINLLDAKTRLQEYVQARQLALPVYRVMSRTGKEHDASFRVACELEGLGLCAEAEGPSMKKAGQSAAAAVLAMIEDKPDA